jgi:CheY-like chemotaxis protein
MHPWGERPGSSKSFSSDRQRIDLVITDLNMPLMDGYQTVRQIRKIDPNACIISMSANCAAEPPFDTPFLEKPFTFATLRLSLAMARGERLRKAG